MTRLQRKTNPISAYAVGSIIVLFATFVEKPIDIRNNLWYRGPMLKEKQLALERPDTIDFLQRSRLTRELGRLKLTVGKLVYATEATRGATKVLELKMKTTLSLILILLIALMLTLAGGAFGAVTFNDSLPMTTNSVFLASEFTGDGGGLLLYIDGDLAGGDISLFVRPFSESEEDGTPTWVKLSSCADITILPAECRLSIGPHLRIRLQIFSGTPGLISVIARGWLQDVVMVGIELGGGGGSLPEISFVDSDEMLVDFNLDTTPTWTVRDDGNRFNVLFDRRAVKFSTDSGEILSIQGGLESGGTGVFTIVGAGLSNSIPSATLPTLRPLRSDVKMGIGRDASALDMTFVRDNVDSARISANGLEVSSGSALGLPRDSAPPFTCASGLGGSKYYDTDIDKECLCNEVDWLEPDEATVCV